MDIEFFGANCVRLKTKETTIVVDDNLSLMGGKTITTDKTSLFYTNKMLVDQSAKSKARLTIETAGEFEVGDLTVTGQQTRGHMDEKDIESATVFQFMSGTQTVTVLGHVHPDLSKEVVELIGGTDVLMIPVGGNGYTLDGVAASSIVRKAEPAVVIPTYYNGGKLQFEVPAQTLEEFFKISALSQPEESVDVFKLSKASDVESGSTKVVVLKAK
jgi:L-ascorbate metabolism protein UlaG (beta-lactamase superfamily)